MQRQKKRHKYNDRTWGGFQGKKLKFSLESESEDESKNVMQKADMDEEYIFYARIIRQEEEE